MVRDNIVIKINNQIADYDDDTAIGITFSSFNPSEIDSIFLNTTNEFTLPITPNNKRIFAFAENTSSNPNMVYDKIPCYIYQDGVSILRGECYLNNITDRYNVQFIEGKNVFDKLKELPFVMVQGDEYPNSLVNLIANDWNTVEMPKIRQLYPSTTSQGILDGILTYCNDNYEGYPTHDYVIPICKNNFAENQYHYDNEGKINPISNNLYYDGTSKEGLGFVLGKYFTESGIAETNIALKHWQAGSSVQEVTNIRYGQTLHSPLWVSVGRVIDILEQYTGYSFDFIDEIIASYHEGYLFMHLPAVEFSHSFGFYLTPMADDWEYSDGELTMTGNVNVIKGEKSWYGRKFDNGNVDDIYTEDFKTLTCLDLVKSIMQEFNLTCDVDNYEKRIIFKKFSDVRTKSPDKLILNIERDKKFYIDNIKQQQVITYEELNSGKQLELVCNNKNIDQGSINDKFLTIERQIAETTDYHWRDSQGNGYSRNIVNIDTKANLGSFIFAYPKIGTAPFINTGFIPGDIKSVCFSMTWLYDGTYYNPTRTAPTGVMPRHYELALYCSNDLDCMKEGHYINCLEQVTVGDTDAYEYYQSVVDKPIVEEITVRRDLNFIHNYENLKKVKINGLAGVWYVQEISKYNPRVDDTMTLRVVKLPADTAVYYTLELNVEPVGAGTVTGAGTYASDELVRVTATPNDGWEFVKWNDDVLSNIRDVYMDSNKSLTALFQAGIPSIYKKVEYLGSTGAQYINTEIYSNDYRIKCNVQGNAMIFGGEWNSGAMGPCLFNRYAYYRAAYVNVNIPAVGSYVYSSIDFYRNSLIINGETKTIVSGISPAMMSYPLFLFKCAGTTSFDGPSRYKGDIEIIINDETVRHYVPVVRISDNKPGLYDKITGQFSTNQGEGEFIVGPDL